MKKMDVIVVGGSAAGLTAAITCRRHYPKKSVLVIRKEKQVMVPCGIPYIFGTLSSPEENVVPDSVLENNGIELAVTEVTGIDRTRRTLRTENGEEFAYEKLVLATGSVPMIPPIPGADLENVFVVKKDLPHLQKMLDRLNESSNLVIVGGGFIGAEFADECRKNRDIKITIAEMLPRCLMLSYDEEICAIAEQIEREQGIDIRAPEKVEAFLGDGAVKAVKLANGEELKADIVILGIGCAPNARLAEKAELELGPTGGIQVNRYMQTSDDDVFACGDCAEKVSFFDGKPSELKLASTATREARIAGANLFGMSRVNEGVIGVWSTVLADTAFALAGLSVREALEKGYNVVIGQAEGPNRHPGSMPEAANLMVKLVFERGTRIILGGQVVGAKCAGELINTISAGIHEKMTADEVALFAMGTHPALTASPVAYQLTNAAEMAIKAASSGQPLR